MSSSRETDIREHGFTAVSRDVDNALLHGAPNLQPPEPLLVADLPFPFDSLVQKVQAYARQHLPPPTFHHSMRVYHFGLAILRTQFPTWHLSPSTYALACLLHDIGTTDANITSTLLSFEYHGAFIANSLLATELHAPKAQVEAVVEAIIRHQDLGTTGMITTLGQVLQLATIFDNMGEHAELVHGDTVRDVVREWPRLGWSGCFAGTIRRENGLKPWCHTTSLGEREFPEGVEGNRVMKEFE